MSISNTNKDRGEPNKNLGTLDSYPPRHPLDQAESTALKGIWRVILAHKTDKESSGKDLCLKL